jgi:hypothetical protein
MSAQTSALLSRDWWLSVFVVGLGINLIASYLRPQLDRMGGWVSGSWAGRNQRRARERSARGLTCTDATRRPRWAAGQHELRCRIRSLEFLVQGALFFSAMVVLYVARDHIPKPLP